MTAPDRTPAIPALARCPNCKGLAFYVEPATESGSRMVFLHMACDGRALSTDGEYAELSALDLSRVYCVSCGWHGAPGELVGCEDPEAREAQGGRD